MQLSECTKCSLRCSQNVVLPSGNIKSPLMVIGDKPNKQEEANAQCFTHAAGSHVKTLLKQAGFEDPYFTLVVKCLGKPKAEHVQTCKWWLWQEIQLVKPKVILTLGKLPSALLLKTSESLDLLVGEVFDADWAKAKIACYWNTNLLFTQGKKADTCAINFFSSLRDFV